MVTEASKNAALASRSLIAVGGEDAEDFLQNLVTCNVENISVGNTTFGALLTPQGKILFDFLVYRTENGFLIDVNSEQADDLVKRLMFYRLRAKVDLEATDNTVHVIWPANGDGFSDPRDSRLGERRIGDIESNATESDWEAHRIGIGFPECCKDYAAGEVFPHEALMDQIGSRGVDFSKGCYVGQEVVSRMQHRGTARSRFVKISAKEGVNLPGLGTEIKAAERSIGKMGSHTGAQGLALMRLDRTAAAIRDKQEITTEGVVIVPTLPDFAGFDWPQ